MLNHRPFLIFMLAVCYGSLLPRANVLQPFSTRYRPFADMIFLNDEVDIPYINDGDLGTGIDFLPIFKEGDLNVTSELKVHDNRSSNELKYEKSSDKSTYEYPELEEHTSFFDDYIETVTTKDPDVSSTTDNVKSKTPKPMDDIPDRVVKDLFISVASMLRGMIDILFGPPPKTNTKKETTTGCFTDDDLSTARKVHKREIGSSENTVQSTGSSDHEHSAQTTSQLFLNKNGSEGNTDSSLNTSQEQHSTVKSVSLGISDTTHEVSHGTSNKSDVTDKSSSIAHTDQVMEHNSAKVDPESTTDKVTTILKVSFVTDKKEKHIVKKESEMLLDDSYQTQDDPDLLNDRMKIAGYDAMNIGKSGDTNIAVKSSSVGEIILIASACVFFVMIFTTGGAALAYIARKNHLIGNPFGNQMASSHHNTNLAHA